MRIGLIDVDGHAKKKKWGATIYPNLAIAKIYAYHKAQGDDVEWYSPLAERYDIVYMTKIFSFSPDYAYPVNADRIVRGGTGYDIHSTLPAEIDDMHPDFAIYPSVPTDISYGFLTRGCPNRCPWCVVPRKEGAIRPYWDVDRVANGNRKLVLMDNNILAAGDYAIEQLDKIIDRKYRIDFNQAIDARLVNEEFARRLAKIKWLECRIRFGCDTMPQIEACERAMELINAHGFTGEYFLYTMIGGKSDLAESHARVDYWRARLMKWRENKVGRPVYACAQPYRDPDSPDTPVPQWQKDMAAWCNKRMRFVTTDFKSFSPRKGFTCAAYFK